jgi:AraC-like DNA-binding protein
VAETRRDRLRELLDVVLAGAVVPEVGAAGGSDGRRRLVDMAGGAFSSPFHFNRRLSRATGEPPVAMRRRVLLERAAWQLAQGTSVTDAAWAAGYESVEGFSRAFSAAFGRSPSTPPGPGERGWLPAPNGIHFHPPTSLWFRAEEKPMNPLTEQLALHDLDDTRALLEIAKGLADDEYRAVRLPGLTVLSWDGPEESIAAVLEHQVLTKEVWLAAIEGLDMPPSGGSFSAGALIERHEAVAARWLATVRRLERDGAWDDVLIDALCDPPESFVMRDVVAHVVTYAAHRRLLARRMLALAGQEVDEGDPITWSRARLDSETDDETKEDRA